MQAPSQGIGTLIVMLGGIMMRVSGLEFNPASITLSSVCGSARTGIYPLRTQD